MQNYFYALLRQRLPRTIFAVSFTCLYVLVVLLGMVDFIQSLFPPACLVIVLTANFLVLYRELTRDAYGKHSLRDTCGFLFGLYVFGYDLFIPLNWAGTAEVYYKYFTVDQALPAYINTALGKMPLTLEWSKQSTGIRGVLRDLFTLLYPSVTLFFSGLHGIVTAIGR